MRTGEGANQGIRMNAAQPFHPATKAPKHHYCKSIFFYYYISEKKGLILDGRVVKFPSGLLVVIALKIGISKNWKNKRRQSEKYGQSELGYQHSSVLIKHE